MLFEIAKPCVSGRSQDRINSSQLTVGAKSLRLEFLRAIASCVTDASKACLRALSYSLSCGLEPVLVEYLLCTGYGFHSFLFMLAHGVLTPL